MTKGDICGIFIDRRRAAGCCLLLMECKCGLSHQNVVHGNVQELAQSEEVVHRGKGFAVLPVVNGIGFGKSEIGLQVTDRQVSLGTEADDVSTSGFGVDDGKNTVHKTYLQIFNSKRKLIITLIF